MKYGLTAAAILVVFFVSITIMSNIMEGAVR